MPGGQFDSSKTRVAPVFDALSKLSTVDWPRSLLQLVEGATGLLPDLNFDFERGFWGENDLDAARSAKTLTASFPHRSADEIRQLRDCLVGITTWQKVCGRFGLDFAGLPRTVSQLEKLNR